MRKMYFHMPRSSVRKRKLLLQQRGKYFKHNRPTLLIYICSYGCSASRDRHEHVRRTCVSCKDDAIFVQHVSRRGGEVTES